MRTSVRIAVAAGVLIAVAVTSPADTGRAATTPAALVATRIGGMTAPRASHQATLLPSGRVLLTGGCSAPGCEQILSSVEVFDPVDRSFKLVQPMAAPRAGHDAIALPDGRVLVSGGWTGTRATASTEIYDPATNRWSPAGNMGASRMSHNSVAVGGTRVLVVGGDDPASAEYFDIRSRSFTPVGEMRADGGSYLPVALADGTVLVTGGRTASGGIIRSAQIFDPATGTFEATGSMRTARHKHAGVTLQNGKVLIVGGSDRRDMRGRYVSTEVYDPARRVFAPGPDMRARRYKMRDAVVMLRSGTVVVAGGAARAEYLASLSSSFAAVDGDAGDPLMFATATVLRTGEVLVVGGYDERIRPSRQALLIRPSR
jgi:hypothetical protein